MHQTPNDRIVRIDKAILRGKRPRTIGYNARIPTHGPSIADPVVRLYTDSGATGIGWARLNRDQAQPLLGRRLDELFQLPDGTLEEGLAVDLPLWDLIARLMDLPLYRLLGARGSRRVELYDGSIYIDDLEADDRGAVEIFAEEVASGQQYGYCNFKIKIGRGGRWMPIEEGLQRDALVIRTVRKAAGPEAKILIDANMGNTLNTALRLLDLCSDAGIYWFEEPFAEDPPLNQALKEYLEEQDLDTLVADGEFAPPANFFDMVRDGLIDVVQHDFRAMGLTWWRATSGRLEEWGARCAPHCWGSYIERYAHAHFAASIPNFSLLEAAPADFPGLRLDGWEMDDGCLLVPDTPGTGFDVDPGIFQLGMEAAEGFSVSL